MKSVLFISLIHFCCCGLVVYASLPTKTPISKPVTDVIRNPETAVPFVGGNAWFKRNKQFCNVLEVDTMMAKDPPPQDIEGIGFQAACYAISGKVSMADLAIQKLPSGQRAQASGIVFNVGHPVADAGDDRSAGPIMNLVLKYWPENYQAVYHAGMAEFGIKDFENSRKNLERFLRMYQNNDYFRQTAMRTLENMNKDGQ